MGLCFLTTSLSALVLLYPIVGVTLVAFLRKHLHMNLANKPPYATTQSCLVLQSIYSIQQVHVANLFTTYLLKIFYFYVGYRVNFPLMFKGSRPTLFCVNRSGSTFFD